MSAVKKNMIAQAQNVKTKLQAAGIKTTVKTDTEEPDATSRVELSLPQNRKHLQILLHVSMLKDEIYIPHMEVVSIDMKLRQVVLFLKEEARTYTKELEFTADARIPNWEDYFDMGLPPSTKFKAENHVRVDNNSTKSRALYVHKATVTASVPASALYFLVGFDEQHMFISLLPSPVETVAEAHDLLLPTELKGRKDYLRQGEFFFVPATEKQLKWISHQDSEFSTWVPLFKGDDVKSDHDVQVELLEKARGTFVTGAIRNARHKPLFLNGWYQVLVNNEIPNPSDSTSWD